MGVFNIIDVEDNLDGEITVSIKSESVTVTVEQWYNLVVSEAFRLGIIEVKRA